MDYSETLEAAASIQLRTHPTHNTSLNYTDLGKKLLEAARNGDADEVNELLTTGAPYTSDWLGSSPLHYAAQYGHPETIEVLLKSGIAKDSRNKMDRTALHVATTEGHIECVRFLLLGGCDVDAKDMIRMTPLHWAIQRGHTQIIELLLEHGADVKVMSKFDETPIDVAYRCGRENYVPLLQKYRTKAKPKIEQPEVSTPNKIMRNNKNRKSNSIKNSDKVCKQEFNENDVVPFNHGIKNSTNDNLTNGQTVQMKQIIKENDKIYINPLKNNIANNSNPPNQNVSKILTINPQTSNLVLLSSGTKNNSTTNGPIKVISKKAFITDIKNSKTIPVLTTKQGSPAQFNLKLLNRSSNATDIQQIKIEDIKKLQDEASKLRTDLEEYKNLIVAKDLEIEKLKKRIDELEQTKEEKQ
ncbi:hypothetical protein NH340_JMT03949 [Sarcoptes scabiei]|nr:hypothetical protein NH340_JMT03949 [Sarcoptes scabiei]